MKKQTVKVHASEMLHDTTSVIKRLNYEYLKRKGELPQEPKKQLIKPFRDTKLGRESEEKKIMWLNEEYARRRRILTGMPTETDKIKKLKNWPTWSGQTKDTEGITIKEEQEGTKGEE